MKIEVFLDPITIEHLEMEAESAAAAETELGPVSNFALNSVLTV